MAATFDDLYAKKARKVRNAPLSPADEIALLEQSMIDAGQSQADIDAALSGMRATMTRRDGFADPYLPQSAATPVSNPEPVVPAGYPKVTRQPVKSFDEQFKELDPYQQDAVKAQLNRFKRPDMVGPAAGSGAPPQSFMGSVGDKLTRGFYRGMENLASVGKGAAWLGLEAAKLPGSISEAVTGKPGGFGSKLKSSAERMGKDIDSSIAYWEEKAGKPKEETWYPTSERFVPKWVPETVGTFTQPAPILKPIPKLFSRAAIKPAIEGATKMGAYSGAVSGVEEFNKPADQRDWSNVPTHALEGAALSPIMQRLMGMFQRHGIQPAPTQPALGGAAPASLPQPPLPPATRRQPQPARPTAPPSRQVTDYVDAEYREITPDQLTHQPPITPPYEPGPQPWQGPIDPRTHKKPIQLPDARPAEPGVPYQGQGPSPIDTYYHAPTERPAPEAVDFMKPPVPAAQASPGLDIRKPYDIPPRPAPPELDLLPAELAVNPTYKDPFMARKGAWEGPPAPEPVPDRAVDVLAGGERPSLVKPADMIPDTLDVNRPYKDPFLVKTPLEEKLPLLKTVDRPAPSAAAAAPSETEVYGPSLMQFLRSNGGLLDQGGEISRMEVPGKPFQKNLIQQESGLNLDRAAELAHEAGYIQNRDINELLGALDNEARGNPAYAVGRANFEGDLIASQFEKETPFLSDAEREYHMAPEDPFDSESVRGVFEDPFLELPKDPFPPDPTIPPREGVGGQTEIDVPPPTVGERPIIGREATPEEAPLFSKAAQQADPEQSRMFGPGPEPASPHEPVPPTPEHPSGHEAAREVHEEVEHDSDMFSQMRDLLNDERGSVRLGGGVGPIERVMTQRRFAEKHPQDFGPVYDNALQRFEWAAAQKHDLHQLGRPYFLLGESDRKIVDKYLRDRRRQLPNTTIPPALQPAVAAVDRMMGSAHQLMNDVRAAKGLGPIPQEPFYVPFARSGDYLTIMHGPNNQKYVSAATTLREAEERMKNLQARFPGFQATVKMSASRKGDLPALDFGTMAQLEKAGFITRADFDQAVQQFDLPPGFSAHFRHAQKILGESRDLLDPIERYIDGVTNYGGRFLFDDPMKEMITKIKDPAVRQYAEQYRDYINTKPQEYSRLRGGVAVWDLALNVGSMFQNMTQVPLLGFPIIESHVGKVAAARIFKDMGKALLNPSPAELHYLAMAEREGHIRPINAEELFGARGVAQQELEFFSPYVQRQIEKGWLPPAVGGAIRKPLDLAAGGVESLLAKGGDASLKAGQKISYAMHRLTGSSAPIATSKAQAAHPVLMQGFAALEEKNRKMGILLGLRTGEALGMQPDEAYEFAKKISRDINFDYSPASRAQAFRGAGAPLGLFMTFQTEYMASFSKLVREQFKSAGLNKLTGPATTALAAFWTIGGMKGLPFVEDFDLYGPDPGMLSQNLPDWAYYGPASAATGLDIAAKFKIGPRVPYDMLHGDVDPSQVPVAQPFVNALQGTDWFLDSPMDAPSTQKYIERLLPPAGRSLATSARWAGLGPAGEMEQGEVGTLRGHTPGPTEDNKREFFHASGKDIAGKALTFTPLELSKQYTRGRIQQRLRDIDHKHTTGLVNTAAHHLDRNGTSVPSPALTELAKKHPKTYAALMKAHNLRRSGQEKGSTEEIYRKAQEPKVIKR